MPILQRRDDHVQRRIVAAQAANLCSAVPCVIRAGVAGMAIALHLFMNTFCTRCDARHRESAKSEPASRLALNFRKTKGDA